MKQRLAYGTWPSPVTAEMLTDARRGAGRRVGRRGGDGVAREPAQRGRTPAAGGTRWRRLRRDLLPEGFSARSAVHEYGGGAAWVEGGDRLVRQLGRSTSVPDAARRLAPPLALTPEPEAPRGLRYADMRLVARRPHAGMRPRASSRRPRRAQRGRADRRPPTRRTGARARRQRLRDVAPLRVGRSRCGSWAGTTPTCRGTRLRCSSARSIRQRERPARPSRSPAGASFMQPLGELGDQRPQRLVEPVVDRVRRHRDAGPPDRRRDRWTGMGVRRPRRGGARRRTHGVLDRRPICTSTANAMPPRRRPCRSCSPAVHRSRRSPDTSTAIRRSCASTPTTRPRSRSSPRRPRRRSNPADVVDRDRDRVPGRRRPRLRLVLSPGQQPVRGSARPPPAAGHDDPRRTDVERRADLLDRPPVLDVARVRRGRRQPPRFDRIRHARSATCSTATGASSTSRTAWRPPSGWPSKGCVDAARMVIRGGSAGGFTVLSCLAVGDVFAAGASLYGVADLSMLASDTHKFEERYLDRLVGPWPQASELYRQRSPIHQLDRFTTPLIVFQGLDDMVVPPEPEPGDRRRPRRQGCRARVPRLRRRRPRLPSCRHDRRPADEGVGVLPACAGHRGLTGQP